VDLLALDRVAQRAHNRLLADHVLEGARAVPAVQRELLRLWRLHGHLRVSLSRLAPSNAVPRRGA